MCLKYFVSVVTLNRHLSSVHDNLRYQCDLCEQAFSGKNYVSIHKKMAHKSTSPKEISKNNIQQKVVQKMHHCNVCSSTFTQSSSLKHHEEVIHNHIIDFKCDFCGKSFSQLAELKRHIEAIHEKITYT